MVNNFLPFGAAGGANVLSQTDYAALTARLGGFTAGVALSEQLNKVWRQSAVMSSTLGQFISDHAVLDALDDGDLAVLQDRLEVALRRQDLNYIATVGGTGNAITASLDPAPVNFAALTGVPLRIKIASNNSGATTLNLNAMGAVQVAYPGDNSALLANELTPNSIRTVMSDGTRFLLIDVGSRVRSGVSFRGGVLYPGVSGTGSYGFDPATYGLSTLDRILIFCWGAGGGGASITGSNGASGAAGGLSILSMNCPASPVTVTTGAGGAGNNVGGNGVTGGTSSFGAHCSATGGAGGGSGPGGGGGGIGGTINLGGSGGCDIMSAAQDWAVGGAAPFMGNGILNSSGAPIGSGGAATSTGPQAEAGAPGAVIVFF